MPSSRSRFQFSKLSLRRLEPRQPTDPQRQQLKQQLRQQAERERLMTMITQRIRQSLNLSEILKTTVTEVQQFLETDRVVIIRFNPDWSGEIVTESVAAPWQSILGITVENTAFLEAQRSELMKGKVRSFTDLQALDLGATDRHLINGLPIRASLLVPILQQPQPQRDGNPETEDILWGLLAAHECKQPRRWRSWEVDVLEQLVAQVGIAIQQSELYHQVQKLNANLERQVRERTAQLQLAIDFEATLKRITDKVRDSLNERQILQTAVQELGVGLGVKCCNASLYDLEIGTSTIVCEYNTSMFPGRGDVLYIKNFPEGYNQLLQGQYFQFCSIPLNPVRGRVAMLACPIVDDQGVLGDLWLINDKDYAFRDLELRLVQQVANQCAIAIRQARLFKAVRAQVTELEKLNQLKDDFLSTVTHELRTPITSIKMAAQMLEMKLKRMGVLEADPNQTARYLQILQDECNREISLVNDLLDLSRLEANVDPPFVTPIHIQDWLPRLVEPFQTRHQKTALTFHLDVPPDLPPLTSDLSKLERILSELLHNACKYTPPGESILIRVRSTLFVHSPTRNPCGTELRISNSGVEIPESEIDRIFEKFYRIPNADPWKHGGTGLGLALVKKLVEGLEGTIEAASSPGWTHFTVRLPALPVTAEAVNSPENYSKDESVR